jgi:hypothetical protein
MSKQEDFYPIARLWDQLRRTFVGADALIVRPTPQGNLMILPINKCLFINMAEPIND